MRNQPVDGKADVYALALILNEMFTGRVPQGSGFRKVSDVTQNYPYLDDLIEVMRQHDSSRRPSVSDLKRELNVRGDAFLSVQKLSVLQSEVIPETDVDDPVIKDPVRMVNVDYREDTLIFTLSVSPPPRWIEAFRNPLTSFSYFQGSGPNTFSFQANSARVGMGPGINAQILVNHTRDYIDLANRQYRDRLTAEHRKKLERQREDLRRKIADEERRQQILSQIKF